MIELRMRTRRSAKFLEEVKGSPVTEDMVAVKLQGETRVLRPDGKPLCVYLPGAARDVAAQTAEGFSVIKARTTNRGLASGSTRTWAPGSSRGEALPVSSAILGSFDASGAKQYCRLTAFNADRYDEFQHLSVYFERIAELFREYVPERYAAQEAQAALTKDDWIIPGTPFTTITVNNTYPTGIHTDKGDLDEGFSTLGCIRRGNFTGGWLTFPEYGVSADMQFGDVLLMDAHDWHGNTPITCGWCQGDIRSYNHRCEQMPAEEPAPERVSIVSYYRTKMKQCGTLDEEEARKEARHELNNERRLFGAEA